MYLLAIIGTLMLIEGANEIDRARKKIILKKKLHTHYWIHGLPLKLRFPKSRLYESAFYTNFRSACSLLQIGVGFF